MAYITKFTSKDARIYSRMYAKTMPVIPPGFRLRLARPSDHDDICVMTRDTFDGIDYLGATFLEYLKDPRRYMFVAENKDGMVVCSYMTHVVDAGYTIVTGAARSHHIVAGMGVFAALEAMGNIHTLQRHPNLNMQRASTRNVSHVMSSGHLSKLHTLNLVVVSLKASQAAVRETCDSSIQHKLAQLCPLDKITEATMDELASLFKNKKAMKIIFPGKVLSASLEPYQADIINLKDLFSEDQVYTIDASQTSLGVFQSIQCTLGLFVSSKLYGELTTRLVLAHIVKGLGLSARHLKRGMLNMVTGIPLTLNHHEIQHLCRDNLPCCSGETGGITQVTFGEKAILPESKI